MVWLLYLNLSGSIRVTVWVESNMQVVGAVKNHKPFPKKVYCRKVL